MSLSTPLGWVHPHRRQISRDRNQRLLSGWAAMIPRTSSISLAVNHRPRYLITSPISHAYHTKIRNVSIFLTPHNRGITGKQRIPLTEFSPLLSFTLSNILRGQAFQSFQFSSGELDEKMELPENNSLKPPRGFPCPLGGSGPNQYPYSKPVLINPKKERERP